MAIRAEDIEEVSGRVDLDRDRVLVVRHQRGDNAAFDELYRRYHPRLVLYCRRRVGDPHVAEELAQEAFLRALRAMPTFGGERRFYPWMTVIAQRLCIDHHRRSARVEPASDVDTGVVEPDHDAVFDAVDHDHLDQALGRLAPRHREVLELREQRGWSYHDIASHLSVPMTTVEALLHRARKALRREFLAVAEDKGAAAVLPIAGLGIIARIKKGLLALGPDRLVPALGAAVAGVAAVGLVAGPSLTNGSSADTPAETPAVLHMTAASAVTTIEGGALVAEAVLPQAPAAQVPEIAPASSTDVATTPTTVNLGVATYYPGPEGAAYVDQRIECMPIHIDLRPVANIGIDPTRLLDPSDDQSGVATEDCP